MVAVQHRLLTAKLKDDGLLTPTGRELLIDYLHAFIERRLDEGWPARQLTESFFVWERVGSRSRS